jgi:hypothetical protein
VTAAAAGYCGAGAGDGAEADGAASPPGPAGRSEVYMRSLCPLGHCAVSNTALHVRQYCPDIRSAMACAAGHEHCGVGAGAADGADAAAGAGAGDGAEADGAAGAPASAGRSEVYMRAWCPLGHCAASNTALQVRQYCRPDIPKRPPSSSAPIAETLTAKSGHTMIHRSDAPPNTRLHTPPPHTTHTTTTANLTYHSPNQYN